MLGGLRKQLGVQPPGNSNTVYDGHDLGDYGHGWFIFYNHNVFKYHIITFDSSTVYQIRSWSSAACWGHQRWV